MRISTTYLMYWILIINIVGMMMTFMDKSRAKRRQRRIPERNLMWVGALGGAASMFLCMLLIRHKTRHPKFMVGLPLMILAQSGLFFAAWHSSVIYFVR